MLKDVVARLAAAGTRAATGEKKARASGLELEDRFNNETLRRREVNERGLRRGWLTRRRHWFERGNGR